MKLKRLPEDFQVEELTELTPRGGPFALYRLTKQSLGTPEAIAAIARRWKLDPRRVSFGGMKDKHALTQQFVTIERGPPRSLRQTSFHLEYLGRAPRAFAAKDIAGNRFRIVVRDLTAQQIHDAQQALAEVERDGLPNYYDDQRFGSVGQSGEFIAAAWCKGNFERALWLALADPHPDDRAEDRDQKRILREHWGDWQACRAALPRGERRNIVGYLADRAAGSAGASPSQSCGAGSAGASPSQASPAQDFRGAFVRIDVGLRGLYLAALQSHLWNRILAEFLRSECSPQQLFDLPLQLGPAPFPRGLSDQQRQRLADTQLPLPSARLHLEPGPMLDLVTAALAPPGWQLRELRVKYPRDSFFSKGERDALVRPAELSHAAANDELYSGCEKLTLSFVLPRGSYATLLCKRICGSHPTAPSEAEAHADEID